MPDQIEAIRKRLEAATLTGPMRVRVGYEGARHIPLIDHGTGLESEVVACTYEVDDEHHDHAWPRARLFANAPSDLAHLLAEVDAIEQHLASDRARLRPECAEMSTAELAKLCLDERKSEIQKGWAFAGDVERDTDRMLGEARTEIERLREALQAIADHPCPNRDCDCGPAPDYHSMGRIARMALGLPEPAEEARS